MRCLQPFPATGEVHLIITTEEGHPVWSRDGRELFFRGITLASAQPAIGEVEISTAPAVTWGARAKLPIENYYVRNQTRNFDVAPDGQRLLVVLPADTTERTEPVAPQSNIVVN